MPGVTVLLERHLAKLARDGARATALAPRDDDTAPATMRWGHPVPNALVTDLRLTCERTTRDGERTHAS